LKLITSGIFTGLVGVCYYYALQTIEASFGIILLFQFVWMGFLVDWIISRRRPTGKQWLAILIVLTGTVLAAGYQALTFHHISVIGVVLGLLAAVCYTANLTVNARVALEVPSALRSAFMLTGAAIVTLIIYPPQFLFTGSLTHGLWLYTLLLGLFGVIIPPYLYAIGIPRVGSAMAAILGSVELPVVILCSSLILHEQITVSQWCGVLLILLGIFVSELNLKRPQPSIPYASSTVREACLAEKLKVSR
jgi:drug/metabolite transporter (DMT)-like permease